MQENDTFAAQSKKLELLKPIWPVLVLMLSFQLAFSQSNYVPAEIVTSTGEVIKGWINNKDWQKNPSTIWFKSELESDKTSFNANQIQTVTFANKKYISRIITYDAAPLALDKLTKSQAGMPVVDTILLEVLFEGAKSLYFLNDKNNKEHFFIGEKDEFVELTYRKYLTEAEGVEKTMKEVNTYKNILAYYFADCATIVNSISKMTYKRSQMVKVFNEYFECSKTPYQAFSPKEKGAVELYIGAGVIFSKLKFGGEDLLYSHLNSTNFNSQADFTPSLGVALSLPKRLNRLAFKAELSYTSYATEGSVEYTNHNNILYKEVAYFNQAYINFSVFVKYRFDIGELHPFVNAGLLYGFATKNENSLHRETFFQGNPLNQENIAALAGTKDVQQGVVFGTGVDYKLLFLEYRYTISNGMSGTPAIPSTVKMHSLLAGLRFQF